MWTPKALLTALPRCWVAHQLHADTGLGPRARAKRTKQDPLPLDTWLGTGRAVQLLWRPAHPHLGVCPNQKHMPTRIT